MKRGEESTLFLENLYKNNKTSEIKIDFKGLDKYNRVLGILYFDNINVNEELIKNGGCKEYIYKGK